MMKLATVTLRTQASSDVVVNQGKTPVAGSAAVTSLTTDRRLTGTPGLLLLLLLLLLLHVAATTTTTTNTSTTNTTSTEMQ